MIRPFVIFLMMSLTTSAQSQTVQAWSSEFWTTVKPKTDAKAKSPDWTIYSDAELNHPVGKIQPGQTVRVTGSAGGSLLYVTDDKLSGFISYKALSLEGQYWVGMSEEAAKYSLGMPEKINGSSNGLDQWIYKEGKLYLYFRGKILESFQNSK